MAIDPKIYRDKRKEQKREYDKIYSQINKEKINKRRNKWEREKRIKDPNFKLRKNISCIIRNVLKERNIGKRSPTWQMLPYTPQQLREHLESLWQPWMTWGNYGIYDANKQTWQIDHILPQNSFDLTNYEQFLKCWELSNLQPLDTIENIKKSDSIIWNYIFYMPSSNQVKYFPEELNLPQPKSSLNKIKYFKEELPKEAEQASIQPKKKQSSNKSNKEK